MVTILQGDDLILPVKIIVNGEVFPAENISSMNVTIGKLKKKYPNGEIYVSGNAFNVPLTQAETFALPAGKHTIVVRPKFKSGGIRGWKGQDTLYVQSSIDEEMM